MQLSRRKFLKSSGISAGGILLPGLAMSQQQQSPLNTLKLPELMTGNLQDGRYHYRLNAQTGNSNFLPNLTTPTYGYNGDFLGPTLRFRRDDDVAVHLQNNIGEPITTHWHGLHVPAEADGGPTLTIDNGGSWHPEFRIMQRAGTFWYHSHQIHKTGEQVYRGLAGMIIIDDDDPSQAALPSTYGVDDIPLIVQDRRFNEDGSFRYVGMHMDIMTGMFGNTILVNGTMSPHFAPSTSKVRFRLLNAANARTFSFAFDDGRRFQQIASDGGLLAEPTEQSVLELAPSERAEIVVDFSDGRTVNLISRPMASSSPFATQGMMRNMHPMNTEEFQILAIEPQSSLTASDAIPGQFSAIARIPESEAVTMRKFTLSMVMGMGMGMRRGQGGPGGNSMRGGSGSSFLINGQAMDMQVVNETINMGDTEIWEITNDSMMMHPFHIHYDQFQILDRDGRPPAAGESGFKDSIKIGPGQTVRLIMRFRDFSNSEIPYMYHCHILEHEDNGMMGQFLVV